MSVKREADLSDKPRLLVSVRGRGVHIIQLWIQYYCVDNKYILSIVVLNNQTFVFRNQAKNIYIYMTA